MAAVSEVKLLPCPFCGVEAGMVRQHSGVSDKIYIVSCKNEECEASLGHFCESKDMAITEWNTRKPMERIEKKIGDLMPFLTAQEVYVSKNEVLKIVKEEGGIE